MHAADDARSVGTEACVLYDKLKGELDGLKQVEYERRELVARRAQRAVQLQRLAAELEAVRLEQEERRKKLLRAASSHVMLQPQSWLSGGLASRVQQQQKKLEALQEKEALLVREEASLAQQNVEAEAALAHLSVLKERREVVKRKLKERFECAVADVHDHVLEDLQSGAAQLQGHHRLKKKMKTALMSVSSACRSARQHFVEARDAILSATNIIEESGSFGVARRHRSVLCTQEAELITLALQAQQAVTAGVKQLKSAFWVLDPELQQHASELVESIGCTQHLPILTASESEAATQTLFEGTEPGDFTVGGDTTQKLAGALLVVKGSINFIDDQIAIAERLELTVDEEIRRCKLAIKEAEESIYKQKRAIFSRMRRGAGADGIKRSSGAAEARASQASNESPALQASTASTDAPVAVGDRLGAAPRSHLKRKG